MNRLILFLSQTPLFQGISIGELESFFSGARLSLEEFEEGQMVHQAGDPYDSLVVLLEGCIHSQMEDVEGKVMTIEVFAAPAVVAPASLVGSRNVLPVSLQVRSPSTLLRIPREHILAWSAKNPRFLRNLLQLLGDKVLFLAQKVWMLEFRDLEQKIAGYLLRLWGDADGTTQGGVVELPLNREEWAEFLGVTRPSLSRSLGLMVQKGWIEVEGAWVTIRSLKALQGVLQEETGLFED